MSIQQFLAKRIPAAVVSGLLAMTGGLSAPVPVQATLSVMALVAAGTLVSTPASASTTAVENTVELSPTPPDITQAVAPNIVVTFDDSGSMASNYMGDKTPFSGSGWSNVWECAALIDPRVTDTSDVRSKTMNGVYYNPNVIYSPPIRADGTSFPNADTSLIRVPFDGIAVNRPYNQKTLEDPATVYDNQDGVSNDTRATDLTGTTAIAAGTGWYWANTIKKGTYTNWGDWLYGTYPGNGFGSGYYSNNDKSDPPNSKNDVKDARYPFTGNVWSCGNSLASPMDGTTTGPDGKTADGTAVYPLGGPYYYRYKSTAPTIAVDTTFGNPTSTGRGTLYTPANWEAVPVLNTSVTIGGKSVNQWQNFANWIAYYRTRNLMTRSSLSRVFGSLGAATDTGGFGSALRVAWQNLNTTNYQLPASAIITSLLDAAGCQASSSATSDPKTVQRSGAVTTAPACYRSAFFNWIFQVPAGGGTPNRASTIRVGQFFQRGGAVPAVAASAGDPGSPAIAANTGATGNLEDPYWEPARTSGGDATELTCRQNFHMLVTDGYWNESDPTLPDPFQTSQDALATTDSKLPDGTVYSASTPESRVYWNVQGTAYPSSLANIAFNYWATNLRPDLTGQVLPYIPDTTTGVVTGATSSALERYFNPKNDPATWPHLVQYMVTLGVPGKLTYSDDADCSDPNNDLCKLRLGQTNSSGAIGWTRPANNSVQSIDDTWHAAINSRGAYFNAANPQNLVDQLSNILTNINARTAPVSTSALNTAVLVPGALGFTAGYSSSDWHGIFQAVAVSSDGTVSTTSSLWDSGQILTDSTNPLFVAPASRHILSSKEKTDGSFDGGTPFETVSSDLDAAGALLLATNPALAGGNDTAQERLNYLRGKRTFEGTTFRTRSSVLGAIINSQAVYVGAPSSGYRNDWPVGSPEETAMAGDATTCVLTAPTLDKCHSYEAFVSVRQDRTPAVYVGANDGMLHAFNALQVINTAMPPEVVPGPKAGKEIFAYVPRTVYPELANLTAKDNFKFQPTVDATPVTRDVFFASDTTTPAATTAGWHTILVGGLRAGGRGVYALDITDPDQVTEGNANQKVLWEFNSDTPAVSGMDPADLGYTYGQPNIGRLKDGKWVVLVPGGYFPDCSKSDKPANCATIAASSKGYSALFILDAQTGTMIRELKTPTTVGGATISSGGLSSVVLGDYNNDQVDDVAFAGDTSGNLWRFDLSSATEADWSVTLAFKPATPGAQPITVMPRLFPDPVTNRFIVVFGTGKYLGAGDNTSTSAVTQSIYGIRDTQSDTGTPVVKTDLQQQLLYQGTAANGVNIVRGLTDLPVPASKNGWYIDLDIAAAPGERVVVTPAALFDTNRVIITTLIPGTANPCNATIGGALMVFNAATGGSGGGLSGPGAPTGGWGTGATGVSVVGGLVNDPPTGGSVPVASVIGGGKLLIPGLELQGKGNLNIDDAIWRRRAWQELNNDQ